MKNLILSLFTLAIISLSSFGQVPEGFKYQLIARDASNLILNNQAVGMKLTILQGSPSGMAVYTESFAPTSNPNGIVNLEIGTGITVDDYSMIDWASGPYFMETAIDVTGGSNYSVMSTSQLMSVPYALYAKTSGNGEGPIGPQGPIGEDGEAGEQGPTGNEGAVGPVGEIGPQGPTGNDGAIGATGQQGPAGNNGVAGPIGSQGPVGNNGATGAVGINGVNGINGLDGAIGPAGPAGTNGVNGMNGATGEQIVHTIGESYGGGIIFYVYDGGQHGLIASTVNLSSGIRWDGGSNHYSAIRGDGLGAGILNTAVILASHGNVDGGDFAATLCNEYSIMVGGVTYGDWYLPSQYELNLLYIEKDVVGIFYMKSYWSSTEWSGDYAYFVDFEDGNQHRAIKGGTLAVRAIRAF
jgi:hypothetical protein